MCASLVAFFVMGSLVCAFADDSVALSSSLVTVPFDGGQYSYNPDIEPVPFEVNGFGGRNWYSTSEVYTYMTWVGGFQPSLNTRYGSADSFFVLSMSSDNLAHVTFVVHGSVIADFQTVGNRYGFNGRFCSFEYDGRIVYYACFNNGGNTAELRTPPRNNGWTFDFTDEMEAVLLGSSYVGETTLSGYSVKPGYALVIEKNQPISFTITSTFEKSLPLFGTSYKGVGYILSNDVPSRYALNNGTSLFPFTKNGGSKSGICDYTFSTSDKYVTIVNPVTYGMGNQAENGSTIYVSTDDMVVSARVIPLKVESYYSGVIDTESDKGVGVINANGTTTTEYKDGTTSSAIYIQETGGSSPEFVRTDNSSITGVIKDAVESIRSMFVDTGEAISDLVNAGGEFVGNFVLLFDFLPAPIVGMFFSAVTVIIIIGVLKVLL